MINFGRTLGRKFVIFMKNLLVWLFLSLLFIYFLISTPSEQAPIEKLFWKNQWSGRLTGHWRCLCMYLRRQAFKQMKLVWCTNKFCFSSKPRINRVHGCIRPQGLRKVLIAHSTKDSEEFKTFQAISLHTSYQRIK